MSRSAQLTALLGSTFRLLLTDHRTLEGQLESIDSSSILISNTLETRPPPTTERETALAENKDRYWPRSDPQHSLEIKGMGLAREIGWVVINLKDILKVEVDEGAWNDSQQANII